MKMTRYILISLIFIIFFFCYPKVEPTISSACELKTSAINSSLNASFSLRHFLPPGSTIGRSSGTNGKNDFFAFEAWILRVRSFIKRWWCSSSISCKFLDIYFLVFVFFWLINEMRADWDVTWWMSWLK